MECWLWVILARNKCRRTRRRRGFEKIWRHPGGGGWGKMTEGGGRPKTPNFGWRNTNMWLWTLPYCERYAICRYMSYNDCTCSSSTPTCGFSLWLTIGQQIQLHMYSPTSLIRASLIRGPLLYAVLGPNYFLPTIFDCLICIQIIINT